MAIDFNLDKVEAPLLLHSILALPGEWEMYSGLRWLKKPAEIIYFPSGDHDLAKPWERMTSSQSVVDWFRFWLKGEEDPDPAKAEQYKRWRDLRKLQGASVKPDASNRNSAQPRLGRQHHFGWRVDLCTRSCAVP